MNNILIRRAIKSDIAAVSRLAIELIDSVKNSEGIAKDVLSENSRNALTDPNSYILVAKTEGKVIGFISFMTRKTIIHSGPCGLIDELVVSKSQNSYQMYYALKKEAGWERRKNLKKHFVRELSRNIKNYVGGE